MLASLAGARLDDSNFVYEPKYDGIRAVVEIAPRGKSVTLWSRLGNDKTRQFPEIADSLTVHPASPSVGKLRIGMPGSPTLIVNPPPVTSSPGAQLMVS